MRALFYRQKQGDTDEKSVIYLAKSCFIVYPCQTARHKAAECISTILSQLIRNIEWKI